MIQELADRDALDKRRRLPVKVEQTLRDQLNDERRHEDLRHASDAETMLNGQRLARRRPRNRPPPHSTLRPEDHHRHPRNPGRDNRLKLIRNRWHGSERA